MNKRQEKKLKKNLDKLHDKYFKPYYIPLSEKDSKRATRLFKIWYKNQSEIYLRGK